MNTFPARRSLCRAAALLFLQFGWSVWSVYLTSSSVLTPKMPSAAPIYDARLSLSLPSVKMGPFQLLLSTDSLSLPPSPRVRGGDVGVARAAKQEKIEPVSNRPRAPATATDQRGVTKAIPCRRTTEIALGSEAFYPPLPLPPPPPKPPSHFSSSTFPAR